MKISKIKAIVALVTGGVSGIISYMLGLFNTQILSKITCKEVAGMYLNDIKAVTAMFKSILYNHESQLSKGKLEAGNAIIETLEELEKSLDDFKIDDSEFDYITEKAKIAVNAWKKAK